MDNNFNQTNYQSTNTMGTAPQKPNILMGALGALAATVVGTIVWILIATYLGYIFFFLGVGIAFLAMFLYEKLAKGIDIVGMIICLVLTCISIYVGIRYGYIGSIAHEFDCSMSEATEIFKFNYDFYPDFNSEYVRNMIMSYVVGVGYTVVMMVKGIKGNR